MRQWGVACQSNMPVSLETIAAFAKRRGFIYQTAEIYGGMASTYDYGPLGVLLKNNIKASWWKQMVQMRNDVVGLDSSILTPPIVWEASGHMQSFHDPLSECVVCHHRFRFDHLLEARQAEPGYIKEAPVDPKSIRCPDCGGELSEPRSFSLLMKTELGSVDGEKTEAYLRGETCQGIYLNFQNVREAMRLKLPFGIAQIGKAFRNEITTKHFTFRTREFEQMEMQFFVKPDEAVKWMDHWREFNAKWYASIGIKPENIRWRQHAEDERAHYAKDAWDVEFNTPWAGWKELSGLHNRGDWDLTRHSEYSKQDLSYRDQVTNEKFVPYIIETSVGADRATLLALADAYTEVEARSGEDDAKHEKEVVLRLHHSLAPIKIAFLPLSKKEPLANLTEEIQNKLRSRWMTQYDETGSIGKRYRRQDEIGTPYCVTVDFESLEDKKVTVRDRDTMAQERIAIADLENYFAEKMK